MGDGFAAENLDELERARKRRKVEKALKKEKKTNFVEEEKNEEGSDEFISSKRAQQTNNNQLKSNNNSSMMSAPNNDNNNTTDNSFRKKQQVDMNTAVDNENMSVDMSADISSIDVGSFNVHGSSSLSRGASHLEETIFVPTTTPGDFDDEKNSQTPKDMASPIDMDEL